MPGFSDEELAAMRNPFAWIHCPICESMEAYIDLGSGDRIFRCPDCGASSDH